MYLTPILICLFALQATAFPGSGRRDEDDARILSEVWDAMDKHRGDDIIVVPRHEGPSEHHGSSDDHSGPSRSDSHSDSHSGGHSESHSEGHSDSHSEGSHDRSHESRSDEPERLPEPEAQKQSESSSESSEKSEQPAEESSNNESSSESKSDESSDSGRGRFGQFDRMWGKLDRLGDIMNRAVDRLRRDDKEFKELETEDSSTGMTVLILEIVGGVVVGLIIITILIVGFVKGYKKFSMWKARRASERLVDQENPGMEGANYQSGYNP